MSAQRSNETRWIIGLTLAFGVAAVLLPFVGPFPVSVARVVAHEEPDWSILVTLRLSRTLLALVAGGALSLAGSLFQAMLRDALATPYTLGISSGASLGAVLAIWAGWQQVGGVPAVWAAALVGAAVALALVVGAAFEHRRLSSVSLLLSGLAINSVCSALILVLYGLVGPSESFSISRWLIGGVDSIDYAWLGGFIVISLIGALFVLAQAKDWNLLAVDPSWAATRGVNVTRLTLAGYGAGSMLTAAAVALVGPIGFLGLIVPHLVRMRIGADHRVLLPCAFLGGGILLAGCDAIGRVLVAPAEVPAGAIMALLGGPYLVWALRRRVA